MFVLFGKSGVSLGKFFLMYITYVVVTLLAATANIYAVVLDFTRNPMILANMEKLSLPMSWIPILGALKGLAATGLVAGIFIPQLRVLTAGCMVLFFVGAILAHLRARDYALVSPGIFLGLAVGALVLALQTTATY